MKQGKQFRAYRRKGKLVIEMPEDNIIFGVENHPEEPVKVVDRDRFLNHIAEYIVEFSPDEGEPLLNKLLDAMANDAVESDAGVLIAELDMEAE
jgi:hypothetical protein